MTGYLYAIYIESGAGSLDGEILGTSPDLSAAREGAAAFRTNVIPDVHLGIYRMERVGDGDDE